MPRSSASFNAASGDVFNERFAQYQKTLDSLVRLLEIAGRERDVFRQLFKLHERGLAGFQVHGRGLRDRVDLAPHRIESLIGT